MTFRHIASKAASNKVVHFTGAAPDLWNYVIKCWRSTQWFKTISTVIIKVKQDLIAESSLCITFTHQLGAINVLNHAVATDFYKR